MFSEKKTKLSVALLAIAALVLAAAAAFAVTAGDASVSTILNTSPLWADSGSYIACNVVNVTTSSVNVSVEQISGAGVVLAGSTTPISLAAGTSAEVTNFGGSTGFARCRFTVSAPGAIRANATVFHSLGSGVFQTYATSEAR